MVQESNIQRIMEGINGGGGGGGGYIQQRMDKAYVTVKVKFPPRRGTWQNEAPVHM